MKSRLRIGFNFITSALGVVIVVSMWFAASETVHKASFHVERKLMSTNLDRVEGVIKSQLTQISSLCRNWSAFAGSEISFSKEKLTRADHFNDDLLKDLNIDFVLFADEAGVLKSFNIHTEYTTVIRDYFTARGSIFSSVKKGGKEGLVRIGDAFFLVSINAVKFTEGNIDRYIVVGRRLSPERIKKLAVQLKINLNVVPASTNDNKFYEDTFSTNENLISVRRLERGMDGSPLFFFLLRSEREILNMGKSFVIIYVIFFILSALITSFLGYYFVKKDCLDRIRYLVAQLTDIRSSKSEKTQVEVSGDDELNKLVEGINNTLDTLQSERGKAETANKVKSEFIANISHEIRTPLNSILGMVELLGETRLDKDQLEYVEIVNSAGKNLLSVINDVLEISKIEAGHLKIEKIEFLLGEMVGRVVSLYSLEAAGKNLSLTCNIPENIPDRVSGDPTRLRQVLVNLISNAIKFTSDGGVEVSLRLDESCCPPKIFFTVSDSGIGIASDKLDDVFASFYQADSSTSRKYGGTGLGLSISHKLITMMGGEITVDSCLGRGTRFTFYVNLGIS